MIADSGAEHGTREADCESPNFSKLRQLRVLAGASLMFGAAAKPLHGRADHQRNPRGDWTLSALAAASGSTPRHSDSTRTPSAFPCCRWPQLARWSICGAGLDLPLRSAAIGAMAPARTRARKNGARSASGRLGDPDAGPGWTGDLDSPIVHRTGPPPPLQDQLGNCIYAQESQPLGRFQFLVRCARAAAR